MYAEVKASQRQKGDDPMEHERETDKQNQALKPSQTVSSYYKLYSFTVCTTENGGYP